MRKILTAVAAMAAAVLVALSPHSAASAGATPGTGAETASGTASAAAVDHTVTFVNDTGRKVWIGSDVNADGSKDFTSLPILEPGQSGTVTIPETADPGHWRGKFFARQGCTGTPGDTFHCEVGDCGKLEDHCETAEQPTSLAEFNFDTRDSLAPWYNVSYVNAFSQPVTIAPNDAAGGGGCDTMGCSQNLLPLCPPDNLTSWPDGSPMLCTNPNRDAKTPYSDMIAAHCPKAYGWSKQDQEPGNQVMQQCGRCSGFTVTFHSVV
ncbi:thaumatin family protein [Streptomyces sp. S465]|uniref:thaumatin family protein n=1 Tax=Streptomyces sp. S465 TaxID=2979468 RepID=UPI0022A80E16|nr:thaumatin family protein [Streptomyces sp. S465]WAP59758.1 Thaumatin pathogenesis-like protein [Streptomyces sp. S465]